MGEVDLGQASIAIIDQERGPVEMCIESEGVAGLLDEYASGFQDLAGEEGAVLFLSEDEGVCDVAGAGGHLSEGHYHLSDHSALLALF